MRTYRAVNLNVLWFLIALNVLIFIIELAVGGYPITANNPVVRHLGLTPVLLSQQPWTIITSMFVHGSWWHILFNMLSLYFLGGFLIRAAGERGSLTVFFLGGLVGNAFYLLFGYLALWDVIPPSLGHPFTPGIGASGAIYALGGALAVVVPRVPVLVFPIPVPIPLWAAILIFLFLSFLPGIAWQAHVGGLVLGLVAGLILRKRRRLYYF